MKKSVKILSILLAMLMMFSAVSVGVSAAYSPYKDGHITYRPNYPEPILTPYQRASMVLDYADNKLLESGKTEVIPYVGITLHLTSIDGALNGIKAIWDHSAFSMAKSFLGDIAKLNINPIKFIRRSTAGATDLDVIYAFLEFFNSNLWAVGKLINGTFDMGAVGNLDTSSVKEIPNDLRDKLWEKIDEVNPRPANETLDTMLQTLANQKLCGEWDPIKQEWTHSLGKLFEPEFGGQGFKITGVPFYTLLSNAIKIIFNDQAMDEINDDLRETLREYANYYQLDFKGDLVLDANGNKIVLGDANTNGLTKIVNIHYEVEPFNFAQGDVLPQLNNLLGHIFDAVLVDNSAWIKGNNSNLQLNIENALKYIFKNGGAQFITKDVPETLTWTPEQVEQLPFQKLVTAMLTPYFFRKLENVEIPASCDTLKELITYAVLEQAAEDLPSRDYEAMLNAGTLSWDDGYLQILMDMAVDSLNGKTGLNCPTNLHWEESLKRIVDFYLVQYKGIIPDVSGLTTAWAKIDTALFSLIDRTWFAEDVGTSPAYPTFSKDLLINRILGGLLELDFERIVSVFYKNPNSSLNGDATSVIIGALRKLLNGAIPGLIRNDITKFDQIINLTNFEYLITTLIRELYNKRVTLMPTLLPFITDSMGLEGEQEFNNPEIEAPTYIYSANGTIPENTYVTIKNASSGINRAFYQYNGSSVQDALYKIQLISANSSVSGVSIYNSFGSNNIINGGDIKTLAISGSFTTDQPITFTITYNILMEDGKPLTAQPLTAYCYSYLSKTQSAADALNANSDSTNNVRFEAGYTKLNYFVTNAKGLEDVRGVLSHFYTEGGANNGAQTVSSVELQNVTPAASWLRPGTTTPSLEAVANKDEITFANVGLFTIDTSAYPQEVVIDKETNEPVLDDEGNPVMRTVQPYGKYSLDVVVKMAGSTSEAIKLRINIIVYNNHNLSGLLRSEINSNRQRVNYDSTANAEWAAYRTAMQEASQLLGKPLNVATFDATQYEIKAENLKNAIKALNEKSTAGVEELRQLYYAYEGLDSEGNPISDIFIGKEDFVGYTYKRYQNDRDRAKSLIDSQTVIEPEAPQEPGPNATQEELDKYAIALAVYQRDYNNYLIALENIPTLDAISILYAKHCLMQSYSRLLRKTASTIQLDKEIAKAQAKGYSSADYVSSTYNAYQSALTEALRVTNEDIFPITRYSSTLGANIPVLEQSRVNAARYNLMVAQRQLVPIGPADFTELDRAIEEGSQYNEEDYTFDTYIYLLFALEDAMYIDREAYTNEDQPLIDALVAAIYDAIDQLESINPPVLTPEFIFKLPGVKIDQNKKYIYGFNTKSTLSNITSYLGATNNGSVEATATEGSALGTGAKVYLKDSQGTVVSTYTVIIFGDINGDGNITGQDIAIIEQANLMIISLTDVQRFAADVNADDVFSSSDLSALKQVITSTYPLEQQKVR